MVLLLLPYAEEGELFHLCHDLFYRRSVESILTCSTSSWFGNSTAVQRHNLNRIMRTAEEIIGVLLPQLQDIHPELCSHKASSILKDPKHPSQGRFTLRKNTETQKAAQYCHTVSLHKTQIFIFVNI